MVNRIGWWKQRVVRSGRTTLVVCLALLLSSCPRHNIPETKITRQDRSVLALLEAAGDRAALVVTVSPGRWDVVRETFLSLLQGKKPAGWHKIVTAPGLQQAVVRLLGDRLALRWRGDLDGWDRSRPVVVACYEPTQEAVLQTLPLVFTREETIRALRHRVIVPATSAERLAKGLARLLRASGFRQEQVAGMKGAVVHVRERPGKPALFAALFAEQTFVRVELTSEVNRDAEQPAWMSEVPTKGAPDPSRIARIKRARKKRMTKLRRARLVQWRRWLGDVGPGVRRLSKTPAALYAAHRANSALVLHHRAWSMADVVNQWLTYTYFHALVGFDPAKDASLLAGLLREGLIYHLAAAPVDAEFHDWTVALDLDGGARMDLVGSLTERGAGILQAGLGDARRPFGLRDGVHALQTSWSVLDLPAALEQASAPRANLLELIKFGSSGYLSLGSLVMRQPLGLLRGSLKKRDELRSVMATASNVALVRGAAPGSTATALAASFSANDAPAWAREGVPRGLAGKAQIRRTSLGKRLAVKIGLGVDPDTVFVAPRDTPPGMLGGAEIDLPAILRLLRQQGPRANSRLAGLLSPLQKIGRIRGRVFWESGALIGQATVDLAGHEGPGFSRRPRFGAGAWRPPGAPHRVGARCLQRALRLVADGLGPILAAARDDEPKKVIGGWQQLLAAVKAPLACAESHQGTRQWAQKARQGLHTLEGKMLLESASDLARNYDEAKEREVLRHACKRGHRQACAREQRLEGRPQIRLARIRTSSRLASLEKKDLVIRIPPRGEAVQPGLADVPAPRLQGTVYLAIHRDADATRVSAVLDLLRQRGVKKVWALVRPAHGGPLRAFPLRLRTVPPDGLRQPVFISLNAGQVTASAPMIRWKKSWPKSCTSAACPGGGALEAVLSAANAALPVTRSYRCRARQEPCFYVALGGGASWQQIAPALARAVGEWSHGEALAFGRPADLLDTVPALVALQQRKKKFAGCLGRLVSLDRGLILGLKLTVGRRGRVTSARGVSHGSAKLNRAEERCVERIVKGLKLPRPRSKGPVKVSARFCL